MLTSAKRGRGLRKLNASATRCDNLMLDVELVGGLDEDGGRTAKRTGKGGGMGGFLRRLFRGGSTGGEGERRGSPLLSENELERIGAAEDLLRNYEAASERNFRAMEAEQSGDIELAVSLYEQSVAEEFVEAHPYERLANIHEIRGDYDEALRITERFISLAKSGRLPKGSQLSANRRLSEFEARAEKHRKSKGDRT